MNAHAEVPELHVDHLTVLKAEIEPLRARIEQLEARFSPSLDEARELKLLKAQILPLLLDFYSWSSVPVARLKTDLAKKRRTEEQLDLF